MEKALLGSWYLFFTFLLISVVSGYILNSYIGEYGNLGDVLNNQSNEIIMMCLIWVVSLVVAILSFINGYEKTEE